MCDIGRKPLLCNFRIFDRDASFVVNCRTVHSNREIDRVAAECEGKWSVCGQCVVRVAHLGRGTRADGAFPLLAAAASLWPMGDRRRTKYSHTGSDTNRMNRSTSPPSAPPLSRFPSRACSAALDRDTGHAALLTHNHGGRAMGGR